MNTTHSSPAGLNEQWLAIILDALVAHGVRRAVLSPGGRSAALVLAARRHPGLCDTVVCNDERSGSFMALGAAKATGEPVLMVTTSGSAVGNVVPALIEADACATRLVILSCDRPRCFRGTGFGQMTDHAGVCGALVRASLDLADPQPSFDDFARLRASIVEAMVASRSGPIHINVPLAGRFDPTEESGWEAEASCTSSSPILAGRAARHDPREGASTMTRLAESLPLRAGLRGLIVVGPEPAVDDATLADFCDRTGFPAIADAASGLRAPGRPDVHCGFDALGTPSALRNERPELILRFGHAPVMPCVLDYLLAHPAPTLKCSAKREAADYLHPSFEPLVSPDRNLLNDLAGLLGPGQADWRTAWRAHVRRVGTARKSVLDCSAWGELVAAREVFAHAAFSLLYIGNSMPIRHADLLDEGPVRRRVLSNRGVCGIDGTVSSFLGAASTQAEPALLVLGDLALLHDLPALASAQRHRGSACICVINNHGGAIFDFLPLAALPDYEVAVRNPHDVAFGRLASAFGLPYERATDTVSLRRALDAASCYPGVSLVEVAVEAGSARQQMQQLMRVMSRLEPD